MALPVAAAEGNVMAVAVVANHLLDDLDERWPDGLEDLAEGR
jgi:hypothetical protein